LQYHAALFLRGATPGANFIDAAKTTDADIVVIERAQVDAG